MAQGYLIFHLNLAFSSIPAEARPEVIRKCYWPLLDLAEDTGIPVGIELTGWTLQQIAELDSPWIERFLKMLKDRQCELIGSGWSQIIGPLVPYEVNHQNQMLGLDAYEQILRIRPQIALVNEMAFSSGMVDVYAEAGYKAIVMDRDNVRLALGLDHSPMSTTPTHALGCNDISLPVLWSDSILFQRLQRVVHGDITLSEYMTYLKQRVVQDDAVLPIYCNDAEIFDYRPGRFTAESSLHPEGEWDRLKRVCNRLQEELSLDWLSPSEAMELQAETQSSNIRRLTSVSQPIPVKKQAKYNINRWAVTGRDDLWLNTSCHQIHQELVNSSEEREDVWRDLCELWASDLRTHIKDERWKIAVERIKKYRCKQNFEQNIKNTLKTVGAPQALSSFEPPEGVRIEQDEEGILWTVTSPNIHLVLNARRGLTIKSLAFKSHDYEPIIGTLPQGYYNSIELGADYYSGGVIIELPGERIRETDLEWVEPQILQDGSKISIMASVPLGRGILKKTVVIDVDAQRAELSYDFGKRKRPLGIVRVGIITIIPESFSLPLEIQCINGGRKSELFKIDHDVDHGRAASTLVSSAAALGAVDGQVVINDSKGRSLYLSWNPAMCAAMPMLQHQQLQNSHLTRLSFSLSELDDTSRTGGHMMPFSVELRVDA
ncbi:glycoside hydrolase family 57 [Pseudomonadota bacterium]